jgi:long-subunit acyl-CoA synthetase (AMP-forming)
MNFGGLLADLPSKKSAIYTLERGKAVRHSYAELAGDVARAQADLSRWGVKAGDRIGIFAPNSYRWLVYDLALIATRAVSVPFTDDFAGKVNDDLLQQYDIALLLLPKSLAKLFPAQTPHVAFMDAENDGVAALCRPASHDADLADQLTLAFSSGSAGGLKGLVISREGVEATLPPIVEAIGSTSSDRLLLFLPMSNFQQRTMCYAGLACDFDVIITDYIQFFSAIKTLNPTILIAPPIYYQMIHTRFANFPAWKRWLWAGLGALISAVPGAAARRGLAQRAFAEIYQQFGGSMRILVTGMAPIKRSVARFFAMIQLPLCESYGLVETGSLTFRQAASKKYGSVGKPLRGVTIALAEDGEVIVRRDAFLTRRYFQCADGENERTFVASGSVATGDIGRFDADGYLYLMGRKKELIITPGGLKIHPEIIEEELNCCPAVAQSVILAKPGGAQLVAVVVLAQPGAEAEARVKAFAAQMPSARKVAPIGEIIFSAAPFSTENGMLRPNLKVDRRGIAANFKLSQ